MSSQHSPHFPQKLLTPLLATGQAVATQDNTVYDLIISTLQQVVENI